MKRKIVCTVMCTGMIAGWLGACSGRLDVGESSSAPDGRNSANDQPWRGNPSDCPEAAPVHEEPCGVSENQICAYWTENDGLQHYEACACQEASGRALRWNCYERKDSITFCPTVEPASGSSCYGFLWTGCSYPPRRECYCSEPPNWRCMGIQYSNAGPSGVDETKPVAELTDADRQTWCEWAERFWWSPGSPKHPEFSPTPEGYTRKYECVAGSQFPCAASTPRLPVSHCIANLSLSSCTAPLAELSDCLRTLHNDCWPQPHGCSRYLETPGCDGTMVNARPLSSADAGTDAGSDADPINDTTSCSIRVQ